MVAALVWLLVRGRALGFRTGTGGRSVGAAKRAGTRLRSAAECASVDAATAALQQNDPLLLAASRLIPDPRRRRALLAVYAWCRRTDDIADSNDPKAQTLLRLDGFERRLDAMRATDFSADAAIDADAIDAALRRDAFEEFPGLTVDPFKSMLNGFRKDLSSDELRFESWDPHLRLYCEQVAGTVGLMLLPLLTDEAPSEDTVRRAVDLGVAIQLTNILRDVGADVDLGRVYLPEEDLEACGITSRAVTDRRLSAGYVDCVKMQVSRARHLYASARVGAAALPPTSRFAVCAVIRLLSAILDELEARNFDNLAAKVRISKTVKLSAVANAAWDALFAKAPKDSPPTRKPLIQI